MDNARELRCARCNTKICREGADCFDVGEDHRLLYEDPRVARLHRAAAAIEARHYCAEPRIREVILFAKELGIRKLGLAFCVGLADEATIIEDIFSADFDVVSVCCKVAGLSKASVGLEQIHPEASHEVMCNPSGQASLLNDAGTELNVLCGLCVGHDAVFSMASEAPVTTLIAKDRVLAHNPVGAIYCQYIRRTMPAGESA